MCRETVQTRDANRKVVVESALTVDLEAAAVIGTMVQATIEEAI